MAKRAFIGRGIAQLEYFSNSPSWHTFAVKSFTQGKTWGRLLNKQGRCLVLLCPALCFWAKIDMWNYSTQLYPTVIRAPAMTSRTPWLYNTMVPVTNNFKGRHITRHLKRIRNYFSSAAILPSAQVYDSVLPLDHRLKLHRHLA